jgi:XRE family transcriptional regulator, regulator of sulfur utilization
MNIGSAIKILRKKKGISQKDFADKCEISVNALCQIEVNNSFPQKSTIHKVCEVLEIPTSYLLFFSISDEDIPEDKRFIFNTLSSTIKDLLIQDISKKALII